MSSDEIQKEYEAFLQDAIKDQKVWLLQNDEGMACQNSVEYEGAMSILMWSDCVSAESEREGEFDDLQTEALGLYELMFHWLPNMGDENVVCCLNWISEDGGLEVEPHDLLEHLKMVLPEALEQSYRCRLAAETC